VGRQQRGAATGLASAFAGQASAAQEKERIGVTLQDIDLLLENNRRWSERVQRERPDFFEELSRQQTPKYLWIGCADSRVPANEIVGLLPGELFVHRNVSNVVIHTDLNCLSVIQFAVEVLRVRHIIVCGHYGCGGVDFALREEPLGLADNWLRHIEDVAARHRAMLDGIPDHVSRVDRLCELNVIEQAVHACRTTIVQDAWRRAQSLTVHGLIYGIRDGLLRDLDLRISSAKQVATAQSRAIAALTTD